VYVCAKILLQLISFCKQIYNLLALNIDQRHLDCLLVPLFVVTTILFLVAIFLIVTYSIHLGMVKFFCNLSFGAHSYSFCATTIPFKYCSNLSASKFPRTPR
jgi:hypothetical protein